MSDLVPQAVEDWRWRLCKCKILLKCWTLFRSPHDIAISLTGDAIYVAETGTGGIGNNIHKFEVIRSPSFFWKKYPTLIHSISENNLWNNYAVELGRLDLESDDILFVITQTLRDSFKIRC